MRVWTMGSGTLTAMLLSATPALADGASVCTFADNNAGNSWSDKHYELIVAVGGDTTGADAEREAKNALPRTSYRYRECYTSGPDLRDGGWYAVLQSGRTRDTSGAPLTRYVAGFGTTRAEAVQAGVQRLKLLPGISREHTEGYRVLDAQEFGSY